MRLTHTRNKYKPDRKTLTCTTAAHRSDCLLLRHECFDSRRHSDPSFERRAFLQFFVPPQNLSSRPSPKTALCLSAPVSSRTFLDRSTELMSLLRNTSEIPRRFKRLLLKVTVEAFSHLFANFLKFLFGLFFLTCRQFSKATFRMWAGGAQQLLQIYF